VFGLEVFESADEFVVFGVGDEQGVLVVRGPVLLDPLRQLGMGPGTLGRVRQIDLGQVEGRPVCLRCLGGILVLRCRAHSISSSARRRPAAMVLVARLCSGLGWFAASNRGGWLIGSSGPVMMPKSRRLFGPMPM